MKTILVPIDFSPITPAVIKEASSLAKAQRARLVLLTVTQLPVMPNDYGAYPVNVGEILDSAVKAARRQLTRWRQRIKQQGLTCVARQLTNATVPAILDEARKVRANYIVVGSHRHNAFYDLLVGSTTHGIVVKATCPVLIVPEKFSRAAKT